MDDLIRLKVEQFVKKVTDNLKRQLTRDEINDLTQLLKEMGISHLDGFSLMLFYLPPKDKNLDINDFISDTSNVIANNNITNSWFFKVLEDYAKTIKEIESLNAFNEKLKIIIKAIKVFGYTFFNETELLNISPIKKQKLFKAFQNEIINTLYTHSQDLDLDSVKDLFRRLSKPLGSSRITKDIAPMVKIIGSIQNEESERIINHVLKELIIFNLIPYNTKDSFKLMLNFKGRVENPIIWDYKDWKLYWLVYFLKESGLIEFIPGDDIFAYIINNFKPKQKKRYLKKNLSAHVSRAKAKIENKKQNVYYVFFQRLNDIFTTLNLI